MKYSTFTDTDPDHACEFRSSWIPTIFGKQYPDPISIRVKSRIRVRVHSKVKCRIRIRIQVEIQDLWRFKLQMESWRAVAAHNGGVEAQNGAVEGL